MSPIIRRRKRYLKGAHNLSQRTAASVQNAAQYFREAIEHDPRYPQAYAGLAESYPLLSEYSGVPLSETFPQAIAAALRAIELDSQMVEPHVTLGLLYMRSWQWADAERALERAIALDPRQATAFHRYGILLRATGRAEALIEALRRARSRDPLSMIIRANLVDSYLVAGRIAEAIAEAREMIAIDSRSYLGFDVLGYAWLIADRRAEAIEALERAAELGGGWHSLGALGLACGMARQRDRAAAVLARLHAEWDGRESASIGVAMVWAGPGDLDRAFAALEREYRGRSGQLSVVRTWRTLPPYRALVEDPRWTALVKRMGLGVPPE